MNNAILALLRYRYSEIFIGSALLSAGLDLDVLSDGELSDLVRFLHSDPAKTILEGVPQVPLGFYDVPTKEVGVMALGNHSMELGCTARSLLLGPGATVWRPERLAPNGVTQTGGTWTGDETDVQDDPYGAGDGQSMALTSIGGSLLFDFPTPTNTPIRTGNGAADGQLARFRCQYDVPPTAVAVELWESGAQVEVLAVWGDDGGDPVIPNDGVFYVPFNAAQLATASGANCQLKLSVGKDDVADLFELHAHDWLTYPAIDGGGSGLLADSPWTPASTNQLDPAMGNLPRAAAGRLAVQNHAFEPEAQVAGVVRGVMMLRDPRNTTGSIDFGEFYMAPRFQSEINRDFGELVGWKPLDKKRIAMNGRTSGVANQSLRTLSIPYSWLEQVEAVALLDGIGRVGTLGTVWASLKPGDPIEGRHLQGFFTLENIGSLFAPDGTDRRTKSLTLLEKR